MSRIDELIAEFCPDGVRHLPVGEKLIVVPTVRGVKRSEYTKGSRIPIVDQGQKLISGYTDNVPSAIPRGEYIVFGDHTRAVKWVDFEFAVGADGTKVLRMGDDILPRFAYHALENLDIPSRGYNRHWTVVRDIPIPVPPLEVQRGIVRILDQFADLEAELEAELAAELEARKRQLGHYSSALLSPDDNWSWTTLGDVCDVFDGPHATPKKVDSGPRYLSISSLVDGRVDVDKSAHLAESDLAKWTKRVAPQRGDTLFSYETRIGQAGHWDRDEPAALGRRMGLLRPCRGAVNPKFLTLAYLGPQFQSEIESRTVSGSTVDRIPIAKMGDWPIAFPALPMQAEIVGLMEQFNELANGFSIGLSAELRARRKQYAYYRDELLTFEELPA